MTSGPAERIDRFLAAIGVDHGAPWLRPPVSDAELAFVEAALEFELPGDLVELWKIHNGGYIFDNLEWNPCWADPDRGILGARRMLTDLVGEFRAIGPPADMLLPGPHTLYVAGASHVAILYDLDDQPGRLLYMDTWGSPPVIPLARGLATLIDAYLALAEAGHIEIQSNGPHVSGPPAEVEAIYLAHHVAGAVSFGIDAWLNMEGSANFQID